MIIDEIAGNFFWEAEKFHAIIKKLLGGLLSLARDIFTLASKLGTFKRTHSRNLERLCLVQIWCLDCIMLRANCLWRSIYGKINMRYSATVSVNSTTTFFDKSNHMLHRNFIS